MNSLNKILLCKRFWLFVSTIFMLIYLYPLVSGHLYTVVYDNLDSNVVWTKILAHSGKIFAPNDTIIPNMMSGLPRSTYGSEFNLILWLYYFFEPQTAYIINEFLIHIIAFIGSYLLLSNYIVPKNKHFSYILIFTGTLYFATLPFWSGSGASIASLPLTTYILLDIKNNNDTKWHWIYIVLLPLYSSLVFVYMFYIVYAGIYWLYDSIKHQKINYKLIGAIFLLGTLFLLKEYRLIYSMLLGSNGFISHRVEFDIFFTETLWETYRLTLVKFLEGHAQHANGLQETYLIPLSIVALTISFYPKRFSKYFSLGIWVAILLSFYFNIWSSILINRYILPILLIVSIIKIILPNQKYKEIGYLIITLILLCAIASLAQYKGLHWITDDIHLLKSLNITRLYFIEPLLLMILFVISLKIFIKKLDFSYVSILLIISVQYIFALEQSFYKLSSQTNHLSFQEYYAPKSFTNIKQDITKDAHKDIHKVKVINYGLEPAVALYNGLYTIDGYSPNYPLSYKKRFRKILVPFIDSPMLKNSKKMFDKWGNKLYILSITSLPETYRFYIDANISAQVPFNANINAICDIGTNYIISAYQLKNTPKELTLISNYKDDFWRLWVYRVTCSSTKVPIF